MTALNSLKKLVRENGYLYTQEVTEAGIRREQLKKYLDSGTLIRKAEESIPLQTVPMTNLYCCRADARKGFSLMGRHYIFMAWQIVFRRWFP